MGNYITVQDIRAAGVPESEASDKVVKAQITMWQQFIERATRQWFEPRDAQFNVDGNGSDTLLFGVPIIDINEIRINDSTTALDPTMYRVYNANPYPDDRKNPRIKLTRNETRDVFISPILTGSRFAFRKGRQNQYIDGTFGYVEADGTTPELIKHALTKLVVEKIRSRPGAKPASSVNPIVGLVLEEWTDGHKVKFSQPGGETGARAPGLTGITQDQEILDIIKLYKGPIGIAVPAAGWTGEGN